MASIDSPPGKNAPISVVIPTYNRRWGLGRCLDSVLNQSLKPAEIIVIDDGSTDGTEEWITPYINKGIIYRKTQNFGVSAARNLGVQLASHDWIAFLDSDDEWLPHKTQKQWEFHLENPQAKISQSREVWIRDGVRVNPPKHLEKIGGDIFKESLMNCMITPSSVLILKSLFIEAGQFDESLRTCEDYDLWLRITAKSPIPLIDEYLLTRYGGHDDQLSAKYPVMDIYRLEGLLKIWESEALDEFQRVECARVIEKKLKIVDKGARKRKNAQVIEKISEFSTRFKMTL